MDIDIASLVLVGTSLRHICAHIAPGNEQKQVLLKNLLSVASVAGHIASGRMARNIVRRATKGDSAKPICATAPRKKPKEI